MFHLHWQMKREKKEDRGVKGLESKLHYHRHFHHYHHYQYDHQNHHQHHLQHCDVQILLLSFGSASDTYSGKRSESDNIHTVCGQLIYSQHLSESYWMILGKKAPTMAAHIWSVMPLLTLKGPENVLTQSASSSDLRFPTMKTLFYAKVRTVLKRRRHFLHFFVSPLSF